MPRGAHGRQNTELVRMKANQKESVRTATDINEHKDMIVYFICTATQLSVNHQRVKGCVVRCASALTLILIVQKFMQASPVDKNVKTRVG